MDSARRDSDADAGLVDAQSRRVRQRPTPAEVIAIVEAFIERRKRTTTADVAIARELAGWCWSLAVLDDQ